jgi:two-component system, OmpR family, sensor histidine kinase KdpD
MARGNLRIFLGAAPGAGKTFALLEEGRRLANEGFDVVVGAAFPRNRTDNEELLAGLEQCPPPGNKAIGDGLDVKALQDRAPDIVLVDDYAATSAGVPRWQQVDTLLEAGIDVISTLDIRNLESLSDAVREATGVRESVTVPDAVVRGADQIELVDASPELLRQRLADGKIYSGQEEADAALAGVFRIGTLAALRELALLWMAERVDAELSDYNDSTRTRDGGWPAREKIAVGVGGKSRDQALVRRAARMLAAAAGGELHVVYVRTSTEGHGPESGKDLELLRRLTAELGGVFHAIGGRDVGAALVDFARSINATQIMVGYPARRSLFNSRRGVAADVLRGAGTTDVHLINHVPNPADRRGRTPPRLGRRREIPALALALGLPPVLQFILDLLPHNQLSTDMLVHLTGIVGVALLGGLWPALAAAVVAGLVVNYYSVRPVGSLSVIDPENVLALLIFVLVAVAVSLVVDRSAKLSKEAHIAGAEAAVLGELSRRTVAEGNSIPAFLDQVREHFQVTGAGLWARRGTGPGRAPAWELQVFSGGPRPADVSEADTVEQLDGGRMLTLAGKELSQDERRLLAAFGAHLLAMVQREELSASQRENLRLAEGNTMRTSILRAVSHDLRTPLAGIKLASSSLRDKTITLAPEEQEELLATIESGADRLDRLVSNLLDMSRITADSVAPLIRPVYWADVVGEALRGTDSERLRLLLPDNMPPVDADPGMLERVIANLVENALKYAPDSDVVIAGAVGGAGSARIGDVPASELTVVDHGSGIPADEVLAMFRPFQRADDTTPGTGIGLGLAVAKGFTEAMGGVLVAEPTPGGGLTMVVRLPLSTGAVPEPGIRGASWQQS